MHYTAVTAKCDRCKKTYPDLEVMPINGINLCVYCHLSEVEDQREAQQGEKS